jgi:hypothetical protein
MASARFMVSTEASVITVSTACVRARVRGTCRVWVCVGVSLE